MSKAKALPGVHAVLTANDLKPLKLHYMPTLAGDVQAVLADEKVLFPNQEVAFVIADDRYIAADAVELIEVEYEALPALVDPFQAMQPDAPVLRGDIKDKTKGAGERRHPNHIFLGGRRQGSDRRRVRLGRGHGQGIDLVPAGSPCPLETCAPSATSTRSRRSPSTAPSRRRMWSRTVVSAPVSGIPEAKVHVIAPDIGGGFGNKVGVYPGYVCAIVGSIVLGR